MKAPNSGPALKIEGHKQGGGYDVFIGKEFVGEADSIKDALILAKQFHPERIVLHKEGE